MKKLLVALAVLAGTLAARSAEVHPLLPDEATTVAYVNVRQMVDLPPAKPHAEAMLSLVLSLCPELEEGLRTVGIKPLDDIDTLLVGARGLGTEDRTLVVTGKFDRAKIESAVAELKQKEPGRVTTTRVGDVLVSEDKVGQATVHAALIDARTLLLSRSKELVLAAAKGEPRKPKLSDSVKELIAQQDNKKSVWAVLDAPEELLAYLVKELTNVGPGPLGLPVVPPLPPPLVRLPRLVTSGSVAVGIDKEIAVDMLLRTGERDRAEVVSDLVRVQKPLFRLLLPRNKLLGRERGEALAEVLADAKINTDKGDVSLAFAFTNETLARIMTPPKKP